MTKNELQELQDAGILVFGDLNYRDKSGPIEDAELSTFFNQLRIRFPQYADIALHIPNEEQRKTHEEQAKLKAKKLKGGFIKGASDIVIPGGPALVIELKREDHTKSHMQDGQIDYLKSAQAAGAVVAVVLGWKNAIKFVEIWHCNNSPVAVSLTRTTNEPHNHSLGINNMSSKALLVAILSAALDAAKNFKANDEVEAHTDPVVNGTADNAGTAGGRAPRGSRTARNETASEPEAEKTEEKPAGRARRGAAKPEEKPEEKPRRSRASKPAEETAEQKAFRAELALVAQDLADVPEAIQWATNYLARIGCKLITDVPADDLETVLNDFNDEADKHFED